MFLDRRFLTNPESEENGVEVDRQVDRFICGETVSLIMGGASEQWAACSSARARIGIANQWNPRGNNRKP